MDLIKSELEERANGKPDPTEGNEPETEDTEPSSGTSEKSEDTSGSEPKPTETPKPTPSRPPIFYTERTTDELVTTFEKMGRTLGEDSRPETQDSEKVQSVMDAKLS